MLQSHFNRTKVKKKLRTKWWGNISNGRPWRRGRTGNGGKLGGNFLETKHFHRVTCDEFRTKIARKVSFTLITGNMAQSQNPEKSYRLFRGDCNKAVALHSEMGQWSNYREFSKIKWRGRALWRHSIEFWDKGWWKLKEIWKRVRGSEMQTAEGCCVSFLSLFMSRSSSSPPPPSLSRSAGLLASTCLADRWDKCGSGRKPCRSPCDDRATWGGAGPCAPARASCDIGGTARASSVGPGDDGASCRGPRAANARSAGRGGRWAKAGKRRAVRFDRAGRFLGPRSVEEEEQVYRTECQASSRQFLQQRTVRLPSTCKNI